MYIVTKTGAQDIIPQQTGGAGLFQSGFEALVGFPEFASYIIVASSGIDGVTADDHTFDQLMRVVAQDVTILKCSRLTLVGVTHNVSVGL